MLFDFSHLDKVEPILKEFLELGQKSIENDSHNTLTKARVCLEYIINSILEKEGLKKKQTLEKNILTLEKNNIIDKHEKFSCHFVRITSNNAAHEMIQDPDYARLCLHSVYILSKWYVDKYYKNIKNINKIFLQNELMKDYKDLESKVTHEQAKRAYNGIMLDIKDKYDAFYFFACANLLNSYVKQEDAKILTTTKYGFKDYIPIAIEKIISKNIDEVEVYYSEKITYVKIMDIQFSFKYISKNEFIKIYEKSERNKVQKWNGIRLQPISGIIFEVAAELRKPNK